MDDWDRHDRAMGSMSGASGCCFAAGTAARARWISSSAALPTRRSQCWRRRTGRAGAPDRGARSRPLCRADRRPAACASYRRAVRTHQRSHRAEDTDYETDVRSPAERLARGRALTLANVAEGAEGLVISDLARAVAARPKPSAISLAVICRDGARMQQLARALSFFAPDLPVMEFPAWDCQPYDRVSPHGGILAQRLTVLARLSRLAGSEKPLIVLTTINAVVQRVPARELVAAQALSVAPGQVVPMDSIVAWLEHNGYNRSSTVREPGEYAVRGGILDLFPAGLDQPVRFDFFGDAPGIDPQLRCRNPAHRCSTCARSIWCRSRNSSSSPRPSAASAWAMSREFGAPAARRSALRGRQRRPPLSRHGTLAAAVSGADGYAVRLSRRCADRDRIRRARTRRSSASSRSPITTTRGARRWSIPAAAPIYKPLPPDRLYLTDTEWKQRAVRSARWRG